MLTGDIGLTGLDALTEGESGFEEALLDAIAKDETLLDPSEMFKVSAGQGEIDAEDAAYWNVEIAEEESDETPLHHDPLILTGLELGGVLVEEESPRELVLLTKPTTSQDTGRLVRYVGNYLDGVHLIHDEAKRTKLQAKLLAALTDGVQDDEGTYSVVGLRDPDFVKYPVHEETMIRYVRAWLKQHRFVFAGCEDEAAAKIVDLAQQALALKPIKLDLFDRLQERRDEELQHELSAKLQSEGQTASPPPEHQPKWSKALGLLAVPDHAPEVATPKCPSASKRTLEEVEPVQLAMF